MGFGPIAPYIPWGDEIEIWRIVPRKVTGVRGPQPPGAATTPPPPPPPVPRASTPPTQTPKEESPRGGRRDRAPGRGAQGRFRRDMLVPLPVREGELEGKIEPLPPVRMTEEEFRRSHRPARLRKEDMELLPVVVEEEEE